MKWFKTMRLMLASFVLAVFMAVPQACKDSTVSKTQTGGEMICDKLPMTDSGIIRLSKIEVYPEYLEEYLAFAREVGEISLKTEPGVLTMYALQDKENPCKITILETYSSQEAYQSHVASPHFQKYKQGTLHMVKHLELCDQHPLNPRSEIRNSLR
ncbi:MAG: antibiotic biosynthesis monooxygenase [Bacteroides sp.]|nr:antibiotic biosynthesis monooxygenase [Ruminococcus flavefaciens]MCM1555608.1 antibiotic biosynthesis monooxygenase [Bacteroides sp.]